jgi:hypothetical protein
MFRLEVACDRRPFETTKSWVRNWLLGFLRNVCGYLLGCKIHCLLEERYSTLASVRRQCDEIPRVRGSRSFPLWNLRVSPSFLYDDQDGVNFHGLWMNPLVFEFGCFGQLDNRTPKGLHRDIRRPGT